MQYVPLQQSILYNDYMGILQAVILSIAAFLMIVGTIIVVLLPGTHLLELIMFAAIVFLASMLVYLAIEKLAKLRRQMEQDMPTDKQTPAYHNVFKRISNDADYKEPNKMLYVVASEWPFKFFPDKLVIQEGGIVIIRKIFFGITSTEAILTADIFNIELNSGPFFASLDVKRRTNIRGTDQTIEIHYLPKGKALTAKEIIDGLLLERAKSIRIPKHISISEKRELLRLAGRSKQVELEV